MPDLDAGRRGGGGGFGGQDARFRGRERGGVRKGEFESEHVAQRVVGDAEKDSSFGCGARGEAAVGGFAFSACVHQ